MAGNESGNLPQQPHDERDRGSGDPWRRGGGAGGSGDNGGGWRGGGGRGGRGGWGRNARGGGRGRTDDNRRPTHFLALRLTHAPPLMSAVAAAQRLLAEQGAAPALVDAASAHLTLCVLRLRGDGGGGGGAGPEAEDEAAVVARCAARLADGLPAALGRAGLAAPAATGEGAAAAGGLALRLGGLGCFGSRVLFMNVLGRAAGGGGGATGGEEGGGGGDGNRAGDGGREEGGGGGNGAGGGGLDDPAAREGFRRLALLQRAAGGVVAEWDPEAGGRRREYCPHLTLAKHRHERGGRGGGAGGRRWQPPPPNPAAACPPLDRLLAPCAAAARGPFDVTVSEVLMCHMWPRAPADFYPVEAAVPLRLPLS